ncbi:MAG TPA: MFS transporter [Verrucomicrobiae bacterium]|nr:MFS transporter [Verrucomicrobiae bacterium]
MTNTRKKLVLGFLALMQFMVVLDSSVVNVALPALQEQLHFTPESLQWVVTAYTLTFGGFLLLGGRMADLFGRKRMLIGGALAFIAISVLIGFSQNSIMLIALRALQGLAAAFMSPAALSLLLTIFKEGQERNRALSVWAAVGAGGAAVGLMVGGALTQFVGWEWNFFINVPIGLLAVYGALKFLPKHEIEEQDKHVDIRGAALVTGGLMLLVYALEQAVHLGWGNGTVWTILAVSALLLAGFIFNEAKVKHPLMPLSIFKIRNLSAANVIMLPVMASLMSMFYITVLYAQTVLQYSPVITGLNFLPIPIIIGVVSTLTPRILPKIGFKPIILVSLGLLMAGMLWIAQMPTDGVFALTILPGSVLISLGLGMSFVALNVAATSGVPGREAGLASGLLNTSMQVGGALGLAILAGIASSVTTGALQVATNVTEATVAGYRAAIYGGLVILVLGFIFAALFIKQSKKTSGAATEPIVVH